MEYINYSGKQKMYEELTEIFSEEHNHLMCRKLLMMVCYP